MATSNPASQTILFLAANPKGTAPLRLDQELRDIGEGLQRAQKRDQFNLEQRSAVRPRDVQRAMLDLSPQIVHFSGHGAGEVGLVFEDDVGNAKMVDGDALANLFDLFADKLNCVVLNGCYSELQAQAIAQYIPYVIGMNKAIGDKAAVTFAVGFYDALGAGRDVEFAFKLGCAAIRMEGIDEHLTPVLIKKQTAFENNVQILTTLTAAEPFVVNLPMSKIRYEFVLSGSFKEINKPRIDAIISHLQTLTGDSSLTLIKVKSGSIKLILEGSFEGFERLSRLIETGELKDVLGIPIQGMEIILKVNLTSPPIALTPTIATAIEVNTKLNGGQSKQLREALQAAFPEKHMLKLLLMEEMDVNLNEVAGGSSLAEIVFEVIKFAEARGRLLELVNAAIRQNPSNSKLRLFAESITIKPEIKDNS